MGKLNFVGLLVINIRNNGDSFVCTPSPY